MARAVWLILFELSTCIASIHAEQPDAQQAPVAATPQRKFDELVSKHGNLTFSGLSAQTPKRRFREHLSFDVTESTFYHETVDRLQLTDIEQQMLQEKGFVSVDHDQRYGFGALYFAVYANDLPVLITSDSILHALHRSYDDILMDLESSFFTGALDDVLEKCHEALAAVEPGSDRNSDSLNDVDLYLTVARNLLKGAGARVVASVERGVDAWDGMLLVESVRGQDKEALDVLYLIASLKLQNPVKQEFTYIYGGKRAVDYSQFKPRGHYSSSTPLARYFRAMMWLGRADTGWNVLPPDPQSGIVSESKCELRNAVILTQLLQSSDAAERLRQMTEIVDFMVGKGDNLTLFQMKDLLDQRKLTHSNDLSSTQIEELQDALRKFDSAAQQIRSQAFISNELDLYQVPPPSTYQMFGQRFAVDSFVLSKVVFDSIIFDGRKVRRMMPTGLDLMFALGNHSALPLLEEEIKKFPYAANLKASQEFTEQIEPTVWRENLYNIWLDSLRTLDADTLSENHFPQSMQTEAWQRKQLQTQLASWAELRHNTVLYAKQSFTAVPGCEYPAGYVEPYPETYARIKFLAEEAARLIGAANFKLTVRDYRGLRDRQVRFFQQMASTLGTLEELSRKELAAQPFTDEDELWLKKLIDDRGGGSGPPLYSGWFAQLYYGGAVQCSKWNPTIVDVHTDPESNSVLEEAVGNCNFLVLAIDNEDDRMVYVGPAYSYYEFRQPSDNRLTDDQWQEQLIGDTEPPRPSWTEVFQAPELKRELDKPDARHLQLLSR